MTALITVAVVLSILFLSLLSWLVVSDHQSRVVARELRHKLRAELRGQEGRH